MSFGESTILKPGKLVPPSASAVERARDLARELCDIATGEREVRWGQYGPGEAIHSAADRLTAVAARLAMIGTLLSARWVEDETEPSA